MGHRLHVFNRCLVKVKELEQNGNVSVDRRRSGVIPTRRRVRSTCPTEKSPESSTIVTAPLPGNNQGASFSNPSRERSFADIVNIAVSGACRQRRFILSWHLLFRETRESRWENWPDSASVLHSSSYSINPFALQFRGADVEEERRIWGVVTREY